MDISENFNEISVCFQIPGVVMRPFVPRPTVERAGPRVVFSFWGNGAIDGLAVINQQTSKARNNRAVCSHRTNLLVSDTFDIR